jgi:predicted  nucleic acid-binding Zn-ribbon protein
MASKTARLQIRIAALEAELKGMSIEHASAMRRVTDNESAATTRAVSAESELHKARETIAELKERLHDAETAKARLDGYINRVNEEDDLGSELVPAEPPQMPRMEPKTRMARAASPTWVRSAYVGDRGAEVVGLGRTAPARRKHWTDL